MVFPNKQFLQKIMLTKPVLMGMVFCLVGINALLHILPVHIPSVSQHIWHLADVMMTFAITTPILTLMLLFLY